MNFPREVSHQASWLLATRRVAVADGRAAVHWRNLRLAAAGAVLKKKRKRACITNSLNYQGN
eukprot:6183051-Pleurochrysis_carterae.AAC.2